jgi:CubicO group peptidase (beta-lactamase class C family)
MTTTQAPPRIRNGRGRSDQDAQLLTITEALNRWPSAGLAVAVIREGEPPRFHTFGVADVASGQPITEQTVFRVGSLTKTFTAIAIMQLWEQGLIDLDAPANTYLSTFQIVPADPQLRPATVRHLLTHTGGVGYWRRFSDLLHPTLGSGVQAHRPAPSLRVYYRRGLPQEIQPGTKWVYSNHGFAALGQIVEDVTGQPLADYLREHVFDPLGMAHTDLTRSARVRPALATGYLMRPRGLVPAPDRDVPTPGGGGAYSTPGDMASYLTALLQDGTGPHGSLLKPATLETMFSPHFQPDPRLPGMGLGFNRGSEDGHRTVGKDGVVAGFLADMTLAPDDGIGVVVLTNTGGLSAQGAPVPLGTALLRQLLGLPSSPIRTDLLAHAEVWGKLYGRYNLAPGPVTNLFTRALMGAGAQVAVHRNQLMLKPITPLPAMRKGMRLHPDDPADPYVFRVDLSGIGQGTLPVAFTGVDDPDQTPRLLMGVMAFYRAPDKPKVRRLAAPLVGAAAASVAIRRLAHGRRTVPGA